MEPQTAADAVAPPRRTVSPQTQRLYALDWAAAAAFRTGRLLTPAAANRRTAASRRTASDQSSSGMSSGRLGSLGVGFLAAMPPRGFA